MLVEQCALDRSIRATARGRGQADHDWRDDATLRSDPESQTKGCDVGFAPETCHDAVPRV